MWKDIISHQSELDILKSYISSQKVPHALLFSGLKGVGKTLVALEFFKAINCLTSPGDACNKCSSCIKTDKAIHPDLKRIASDGGEIKVENIRLAINEIGLRPFEARYRFIIIEPAELLNKSGSNALLKTLEEPPPHTIIILISHKPGLLLPTIISRCQEIMFKPIDPVGSGFNIDPVMLRLTSGTIGGLSEIDTEFVKIARNTVINVINGSDPYNAAGMIAGKGSDVLIVLMIIESFIRDIMLLSQGSGNIINEELRMLSIGNLNYTLLEDIIIKVNEIRSMKDSSINIKNAINVILYELRSLVRSERAI